LNFEPGASRFIPRDPTVRSTIDKGSVRLRILGKILMTPNGATCEELEIRLGLSHQTASAAITALVKKGILVDSGERRTTRSGRKARVYVRRKERAKRR